jgi:hypothetical protein
MVVGSVSPCAFERVSEANLAGYPQTTDTGFQYNGESDLDLEYAQALVGKQTLTLYQVGDVVEGASFNVRIIQAS